MIGEIKSLNLNSQKKGKPTKLFPKKYYCHIPNQKDKT